MDLEAQVKKASFTKSLIKSAASLTYSQAQEILDEKCDEDGMSFLKKPASTSTCTPTLACSPSLVLKNSIRLLNFLAQRLRSRRMEAGALTLASSEIRFEFESGERKGADPLGISSKSVTPANELVEEFMLLANVEAAKLIYSAFPDQALLRRHPSPPDSNFAWLLSALKACNLPPLDISSSKRLGETLDLCDAALLVHLGQGSNACLPPEPSPICCSNQQTKLPPKSSNQQVKLPPKLDSPLRLMATRAMMQAVYFSSGSAPSPSEFWHYGLAAPIYTHFTSPIRRYSDVIVHRLISLALSLEDTNSGTKALSRGDLEKISTLLNHRHRRAQLASRASTDLFTSRFLERPGETDKVLLANVVRVAQNGLVLLIQSFGIECFLKFAMPQPPSDALPIYDAEMMAWKQAATGQIFVQIFDSINVRLHVYKCPKNCTTKLFVQWVDVPDPMNILLPKEYPFLSDSASGHAKKPKLIA